jgi:site-specific recombinase XerD
MTRILHQDPERRCKPIEEWPEQDRALWLAALVPGDLLEEGGSRARWKATTNAGIVNSYGRWLQWLDRRGELDPAVPPADRVTPERVRAYLEDLERLNATQTVLNRHLQLVTAALVMDPARDWSWLRRRATPIRARHRPARPKEPRLASPLELYELGLSLMTKAEQQKADYSRATAYRDGLMLALLACRPIRITNFVGLTLDRTLVRRDKLWWIQIAAEETKTKEPIESALPEALTAPVDTYLAWHRPVLAQRHGRWTRPVGDALWLSIDGSPMTRRAIYDRITQCTLKGLGRAINPHLFRDCGATAVALEDPVHVRIASTLLSHRTFKSTEKYYNQARGVEAVRTMQKFLLSLRQI